MSDNSVICQSAECEEYFDKLEQELKETQEKLKYYENGFKGACTTCENVGEINLKISEKLEIAVDALEFYGDKDNWYNKFRYGADDLDQLYNDCDGDGIGGYQARQALEKIVD